MISICGKERDEIYEGLSMNRASFRAFVDKINES